MEMLEYLCRHPLYLPGSRCAYTGLNISDSLMTSTRTYWHIRRNGIKSGHHDFVSLFFLAQFMDLYLGIDYLFEWMYNSMKSCQ